MPFYKISLTLMSGKSFTGIREFHIKDIEYAYEHFEKLAEKSNPGQVFHFDCVMISQKSIDFLNWKKANGRGGPGRYRSGNETKPDWSKRNEP